jgi:ABC-type phosphate/phosphonate transport system substrate-binding protein
MLCSRQINPTNSLFALVFIVLVMSFSFQVSAKEYSFVVQPIYKPDKIKAIYQPFVEYLKKETGATFNVIAEKSFLTYWIKMKKGKYDLIMDAAHFTDYRITHMDYQVLVKMPDTVTFSLITNSKEFIFDEKELVGKKLITFPPPSLGSTRLVKMFPNPLRQPRITSTNSAIQAIKAVQRGEYFAALVPTPMLNQFKNVNTVSTTQPVPHMAISASGSIDKELQSKIRVALLKASGSEQGRKMLNGLNITSFKTTTAKAYRGYEKLLAGVWGY